MITTLLQNTGGEGAGVGGDGGGDGGGDVWLLTSGGQINSWK